MVIAHRLSTIRDADCIYVMNKGVLSEQGTHDELITKAGLYSELVQTQLAAEYHVEEEVDERELEEKVEVKAFSRIEAVAKEEVEIDAPTKEKQDAVFGKLVKL